MVKIARARAQTEVQPQRLQPIEFVLRARRADHLGAQHFGCLERGHADAGRNAAHQHPFIGCKPSLGDEHVVHHHECQWNRGSFLPCKLGRYSNRFAKIHQRVFGERTGATPHHALPHLDAGHPRGELDHLACALHPDGFGRTRLLQAVSDDEFAAIEACRAHLHQHLLRARFGYRGLAQFERGLVGGGLH